MAEIKPMNTLQIADLPEEVLEYILLQVSPYKDLKSAMQVCKQWNRLVSGVKKKMYESFVRGLWESNISWSSIHPEAGTTITERYSHCACYFDRSVYIFGGCTGMNTTFNDLWRFDLSTRQWIRPLAMGTYPSPKACASMVVYRESLVLFGGWSHPTPYPLHQAARFFSELHIYSPLKNRWSHVTTMSPVSPKPTAGHSASIIKDYMIVFGGSHVPGLGSNEVWVFDLVEMIWRKQNTSNRKPNPRYGQTQLTMDKDHILIIGGCGGPNQIFSDMWLLSLDTTPWQWSEIQINFPENAAPRLWCHAACKVADMVVVLSKPAKPFVTATPAKKQIESPSSILASMAAVTEKLQSRLEEGNKHRLSKRPLSEESSGAESSGDEQFAVNGQVPFKHPGNISVQAQSNKSPEASAPICDGLNISESSDIAETTSMSDANKSSSGSMKPGENGTRCSPLRPGHPSIRPNAMRNRQKQLEMLRKFEERLKNNASKYQESDSDSSESNGVSAYANFLDKSTVTKENRCPVQLHVLDLHGILSDGVAKWRPIKPCFSQQAPDETVFYSLVEGRGELIMFGGIQKDIESMQRGVDIKSHVVSNNLYILSGVLERL
ncbi:hypothetical protein ScPMuIL_008703 [Solemya velum]